MQGMQRQFPVPHSRSKMEGETSMNKSLSEICDELSGRVSNPPSRPVRFSSWENCPLCDSMFIEVHDDGIYKPEAVCTDCGISLQGKTVFEIKERWKKGPASHCESCGNEITTSDPDRIFDSELVLCRGCYEHE